MADLRAHDPELARAARRAMAAEDRQRIQDAAAAVQHVDPGQPVYRDWADLPDEARTDEPQWR